MSNNDQEEVNVLLKVCFKLKLNVLYPTYWVSSRLARVGGSDTRSIQEPNRSVGTGTTGRERRMPCNSRGPWGLSSDSEEGRTGGKGTFQGRTAASEGGRLQHSLTISCSASPLRLYVIAVITWKFYRELSISCWVPTKFENIFISFPAVLDHVSEFDAFLWLYEPTCVWRSVQIVKISSV